MADNTFVNYNGQQVLTGDTFKANLEEATKLYNQSSGKNLSAKDYDYLINPKSAGARWGEATTPSDFDPTKVPTTPAAPSAGTGTGLLGSTPGQVKAQQAQAATYNPVKQTVSDQSTVQNQLANITASGSKLNTLAAAEANKQASRRGLLNSSIAVGAGEKAVLQSALPIAQQDAATYANTDSANAQYSNAAGQFNAAQQNQISQFNANLGTTTDLQQALAALQSNTQISLADKDNQTKVLLAQLNANTQKEIANLGTAEKVKLSQLEADNRQLLQTNISAANAYAQYTQALSGIQNNKDLDQAAKQEAADSQLAALQAALRAFGKTSNLDLSQFFQSATSSFAPPVANNGGNNASNQQ